MQPQQFAPTPAASSNSLPRLGFSNYTLMLRLVLELLGKLVAAGPEIDNTESWESFRRANPARCYAISKRALSRSELRRYGLRNAPCGD